MLPAEKEPVGLVVVAQEVGDKAYTADAAKTGLFLLTSSKRRPERVSSLHPKNADVMGDAVREPKMSASGGQIAFLADRQGLSDQTRLSHIGTGPTPYLYLNVWVADLKERVVRQLTSGDRGWRNVSWLSPSELIAVHTARETGFQSASVDQIVRLDTKTNASEVLLTEKEALADVLWWPRSRLIAYTTGLNSHILYGLDPSSRAKRRLYVGQGSLWGFREAPIGTPFALVEKNETTGIETLKVIDPKSRSETAILRASSRSGFSQEPLGKLLWSPEGSRLAVAEYNEYTSTTRQTTVQLVTPSSGRARALVTLSGIHRLLSWSRDGKWIIAYTNGERSPGSLVALHVQTGRKQTLARFPKPLHGLDWKEVTD